MDRFQLRAVGDADSDLLFRLLEERPTYANISHKGMPSRLDHDRFVRTWPSRYEAWYIVLIDGTSAGSVYLTHTKEIGLFILKEFQGKGYGARALARLIHTHPKDRYIANIAPRNDRSAALFQRHGFAHVQNTYVMEAA